MSRPRRWSLAWWGWLYIASLLVWALAEGVGEVSAPTLLLALAFAGLCLHLPCAGAGGDPGSPQRLAASIRAADPQVVNGLRPGFLSALAVALPGDPWCPPARSPP